jgi:hypothetical protein
MSAVAFSDAAVGAVAKLLEKLRADLGRGPGQELHWSKINTHQQRLHIAQTIGSAGFLTISSVIVCKRHFSPGQQPMAEDPAYLYTLRFLLERLSWIARDTGYDLEYTLAHVVRFKVASLREYERLLRAMPYPECRIAWGVIKAPGQIDQPARVEALQLSRQPQPCRPA